MCIRDRVITEPVVIAVQFPQKVIDDDAASQNDTGFIHLQDVYKRQEYSTKVNTQKRTYFLQN